ncbi:MAG TPA: two-component regulator propeller domain-containing protein [Bacteroidia bacterium]
MKYLRKIIEPLVLATLIIASCNGKFKNKTAGEKMTDALKSSSFKGMSCEKNESDSVFRKMLSIQNIYQDHCGNYWFATHGQGVCKYDGKNYVYFTVEDGLFSNHVYGITEDSTNIMWFNTARGICGYNGKKFIMPQMPGSLLYCGNSCLNANCYPGTVRFGTPNGSVRFNGTFVDHLTLPVDDEDFRLKASLPLNSIPSVYAVYSVLEDKKGVVWMGTENRGVCRYDGKSYTWFRGDGLDKGAVRSIYQDKEGNIWFGNNGMGVYKWNGDTMINFTAEKGLQNKEFLVNGKVIDKKGTLARVWSINEDNQGNLWFATIDAGLWQYNGTELINHTEKGGLISDAITSIYKDKKGKLWFGTEDKGVFTYDGKSFKVF